MGKLRWVHWECYGKNSLYKAFDGSTLAGTVERYGRMWMVKTGSQSRCVETLALGKALVQDTISEPR